ncbi:MAG: cytochrome b [Wenzhouxiangellaceae bacterium]
MDNARTGYGRISRLNHWVAAAVVIGMLTVGLYFHDMPRGEEKLYWLHLHISVGALAWLWIMFRVFWRMGRGFAPAMPQAAIKQHISKLVHVLLLTGILVMFISGPLTIWTGGRAIEIFGLISIPSPIPEMHDFHELLEEVHEITARVMIGLISLHVLATIMHLVFHRQALRGRMWGRSD